MNILITGGTGLIGRALIDRLLIDGHQIFVLTRNQKKAKDGFPVGVLVHQWDGASPDGWAHIIEEIDAVVNLAGESIAGDTLPAILTRRWTKNQKKRIKESRFNSGQALTEAIQNASHKPSVFVQASAVGYYGPQGNNIIPEDTPNGTDYLAKVCQGWEESTAKVEQMGIRRHHTNRFSACSRRWHPPKYVAPIPPFYWRPHWQRRTVHLLDPYSGPSRCHSILINEQ